MTAVGVVGADGAGWDVLTALARERVDTSWMESREGAAMRLMGWTDRSMLDLYAEDLQMHRAIQAKRRRGDLY